MKVHCTYDQLVPISSLNPHPKNTNKHSKEQIQRLAKILEYQGWRYPIKVSKQSGFITSGHGRLEAARLLKLDVVPVNFQDYENETQELADLTSDNAIAAWAELDLSLINTQLGDMGPDFDLDLLGIKDFVLEPAELVPQCDEDEVPEHVEPKAKLGDIYQLGDHRLMCGDSTVHTDFDLLMAGSRADICFTSPPYNVGANGNMKGQEVGKKYLSTADDRSESEYLDFLTANLNLCMIHSSEVFYNIQLLGANKSVLIDLMHRQKEVFKDLMYWVKDNAAPHIEPGIMSSYVEWIICMSMDNQTKKFHKTDAPRGTLKNIIRGPGNGQNEFSKIHNATFPVYLAEHVIENFSQRNMSVLDTFGGSGTTLIACEKTNRRCFMMELDPKYCDVIVARWEKYTGKKAELINGTT